MRGRVGNMHSSSAVDAPASPRIEFDWLQLLLLAICVGDLVFFTYYLFAYELARQNTISDSLFEHGAYTVILTTTLSIRMLGVVCYTFRFRNENTPWVVAGLAGVCITLAGW